MMKYLQAVILSCFFITLIGCASTRARDKPQLNPHPKHFLTIKGYIAPELKGKVYLAFVQTYAASNKKCMITTNWLEGIKGYPVKRDPYSPKPNKAGEYKLIIPIDKYLPGKCDWKPLGVGYNLTKSNNIYYLSGGYNLIIYDNKGSQKHNPKIINFICKKTIKKNPDDYLISVAGEASNEIITKTNQSFVLTLNIFLNREHK